MIMIPPSRRTPLVKQYQRLFEPGRRQVEFEPEALEAIADQAMQRGTGARGLRAIMEEVLPQRDVRRASRDDVAGVVITRDVVEQNVLPTIVPNRPARRTRERREDRLGPDSIPPSGAGW